MLFLAPALKPNHIKVLIVYVISDVKFCMPTSNSVFPDYDIYPIE